MSDQAALKRTLQELIKREDLKNKTCVDCGNPNPQWVSVSFAIFICLQCAGLHRGYGVHISFVRSVSMDTWSEEQVKRMQLGGNGPFKTFIVSYSPQDQGGYTEGMPTQEVYHCWAATQYKQKLDFDLSGQPWSPSPPPPETTQAPGRPDSAQSLRKSRASGRSATGSTLRSNSGSPAPFGQTSGSFQDQKSANEAYFNNMGNLNASRPADLPPSQGGRYQGFGSTPTPSDRSQNPSFGSSSAAAPSLSELTENPTAALSKGWSLLSAVVTSATRAVNESVIQPGMEKVLDPEFQSSVRGLASQAGQRAGAVGNMANQWGKSQFGVDVASQVGGVVGGVTERLGGGRGREGYGAIGQDHDGESSALYHDDDEDDFFGPLSGGDQRNGTHSTAQSAQTGTSSAPKKGDDWDEWKDF